MSSNHLWELSKLDIVEDRTLAQQIADNDVPELKSARGQKLTLIDGRVVDNMNRSYKIVGVGARRRWVLDDEASEQMREFAMKRYYAVQEAAKENHQAYLAARRAYFHRVQTETEEMRLWTPRDIADMFHASTEQIRGWMKRMIDVHGKLVPVLEHVVINGRYYSSSDQVISFWLWSRQHELNFYRYAGAEFGRLARLGKL